MSTKPEISCSYCGKSQDEVDWIFRAYANLCNECIRRAAMSVAQSASGGREADSELESTTCTFCHKRAKEEIRMMVFDNGSRLCFGCTFGSLEPLLNHKQEPKIVKTV